jgi:transposase
MAVELLPDELWQEIEPLLPPPPPRTSKGGRPPADPRDALRGIIFVARTGIPWQMLPREAFKVSGSSCWRRLRDWTEAGIWPELHKRLLNRLGKLHGVGLERVVVDSQSVRALKGARTPDPTLWTGEKAGANATS